MGKAWSNCDPGFYSTKGVNPLSNSEGFYCAPCPIGYWCPGGEKVSPVACRDGWYGIKSSSTSEAEGCQGCPEGYACKAGSATPKPCGPGTYAAAAQGECGICTEGHYCPGLTADIIQCEPGYVSLTTGASHCNAC